MSLAMREECVCRRLGVVSEELYSTHTAASTVFQLSFNLYCSTWHDRQVPFCHERKQNVGF